MERVQAPSPCVSSPEILSIKIKNACKLYCIHKYNNTWRNKIKMVSLGKKKKKEMLTFETESGL